jgi:APA family basic amino acid/polyamine antiporter
MISRINPTLEREIKIIRNRNIQKVLGWAGILILSSFLIIHIWKDLSSDVEAWYYHSTTIWLIVMTIASVIFFKEFTVLKKRGIDTDQVFNNLPPE